MNTYGTLFKVHIFGESHNSYVGISIDHVPAGIIVKENDFSSDLIRRQGGNHIGSTPRKEADIPEIISGTYQGRTTGAPLTVLFKNNNTRPRDYQSVIPRPGHSDFTAQKKYNNFHDPRGGGHFSGRLTVALVAAGVVAKKIIHPIHIQASIKAIGKETERSKIEHLIKKVVQQKDSIGGLIACSVLNMPVGLGEPFFNSIESAISSIIFSIPAVKGIAFGSGFNACTMRGSEHNDPFINASGHTKSNHSGGINGGISNGNPMYFEVAVKPTSSIGIAQNTFNPQSQNMETIEVTGRHDACIALRVPVIIEAATAIALADLYLQNKSRI